MIYYKTREQVEKVRKSCLIVSEALTRVAELLGPGSTGLEIDAAAEEVIRDHGAIPGFKGYNGFPSTLCVSVNQAVVHGIPGKHNFEDGDIVSVDCGSLFDGFYGDAAYTFAVGDVDQDIMTLLEVTKTSLHLAIEKAVEGNRIGDIGDQQAVLAGGEVDLVEGDFDALGEHGRGVGGLPGDSFDWHIVTVAELFRNRKYPTA